jgi:hypothetical protein
MEIAFMIFGLAFFLFVTRMISRDHRESWERRIMEAREFGFGGRKQHNSDSLRKH